MLEVMVVVSLINGWCETCVWARAACMTKNKRSPWDPRWWPKTIIYTDLVNRGW
jgi:hypothetical protein